MRKQQVRGFTLIELLIAVAVVAILMSLAIGSYEFAMVKARRGAAQACMMEAAQVMERNRTFSRTYLDAGGNVPDLPDTQCRADLADFYDIELVAAGTSATTYRVEAVPTDAQDDGLCGTMTIDHTGLKTEGGSATDVDDCW